MSDRENSENKAKWKDFTSLWLARARTTQDPLFQFMCFMIAFNNLWTLTDEKAANASDGKESTFAKQLIAKLTWRVLNKLKTRRIPFSLPPLPELHEEIHEGNASGESTLFVHWGYGPSDSRPEYVQEIVDIFIKIYIVRNNLFHGWKTNIPWDVTDFRDNKLVEESCMALEPFLKAILCLDSLPGIQPQIADRKDTFQNTGLKHS